jgi:hypothetical protein
VISHSAHTQVSQCTSAIDSSRESQVAKEEEKIPVSSLKGIKLKSNYFHGVFLIKITIILHSNQLKNIITRAIKTSVISKKN